MPHFNVSVAEVGDCLPNGFQEPVTSPVVFIQNNRVSTPGHALWRMPAQEARELAQALISAADHLDRVPPPRPVWEVGPRRCG